MIKSNSKNLGINLSKAIDLFNRAIKIAGSPKNLVDKFENYDLLDTIKDCINSAKLVKSDADDVLALALILRSRVLNGASIGGFTASSVVDLACGRSHTTICPFYYREASTYFNVATVLSTIKQSTIDKYKQYLDI